MVQEVRTIKFGMQELEKALNGYRRIHMGVLPAGRIAGMQPGENKGLNVTVETSHEAARHVHVVLNEEDVSEALIRFCIENNVILPRRAAKELLYADGFAMLLIEMEMMVG
jgi:hypothetical protein